MGETTDEVRPAADLKRSAGQASGATGASKVEGSVDGDQEAAQIRSGIEQTRASLSHTIGALQEKLDPANIAEQVKDQIREKATEAFDTAKTAVKEATIGKAGKIMSSVTEAVSGLTGHSGSGRRDTGLSFVQYIRDNPVPFALVGIGVGMLAWNKRESNHPTYRNTWPNPYGDSGKSAAAGDDSGSGLTENARAIAGRASTAVSSAASSVKDAAGTAAEATRQKLNYVSDQARQGAQTANDRFKTTLQENPMALGVAALAAGAIVGLSLPTTRVEAEYMGEARDRLVDQAKSVAQEAAQKVQRVTQEAGRTLKDVAQKEGLPLGQSDGNSA